MHIYDMLIIGGGPGGYTAALYGARAGLDVLVLEKMSAGGQMALTSRIDNYPGFDSGIDGFTLGQKMQAGAERFGAETRLAQVQAADLSGPVKQVTTSEGIFYGKTVVLATGANPRHLDVPGEQALLGRGVSYCAACDGMFYKGKTVAVIGGGNTAAATAMLLSRICRHVFLIHRRDSLRASKVDQAALDRAENITFRFNAAVSSLLGGEKLTGITLQDVNTGETSVLDCDGVFVCIGRAPVTELVKDQLTLDPAGYVTADESTQTSLPGVFAVGDVRTKQVRQIITAAADGAVAAHNAEAYLTQAPQ